MKKIKYNKVNSNFLFHDQFQRSVLFLFDQGVYVQGVCVLGGKCPGGKRPGGKCPGGICPWGKCLGGTCPGGLCPRTIYSCVKILLQMDSCNIQLLLDVTFRNFIAVCGHS